MQFFPQETPPKPSPIFRTLGIGNPLEPAYAKAIERLHSSPAFEGLSYSESTNLTNLIWNLVCESLLSIQNPEDNDEVALVIEGFNAKFSDIMANLEMPIPAIK